MSLSKSKIDKLKPKDKPYRKSDGRGLYIQAMPSGAKYWRIADRFLNKKKTYAVGVYPDTSLEDARIILDEVKSQVAKGIDPSAHKHAKREAEVAVAANSFEVVALEWFEKKMKDKSRSHKDKTLRTLQKDIFPYLGKKPISTITAPGR